MSFVTVAADLVIPDWAVSSPSDKSRTKAQGIWPYGPLLQKQQLNQPLVGSKAKRIMALYDEVLTYKYKLV